MSREKLKKELRVILKYNDCTPDTFITTEVLADGGYYINANTISPKAKEIIIYCDCNKEIIG